jgi:hypothetical protein
MAEGKWVRVIMRRWGSFVIGTHNRSRKNSIECEIDGSVKNKRRIEIQLVTIEIIRTMSDDFGALVRKS